MMTSNATFSSRSSAAVDAGCEAPAARAGAYALAQRAVSFTDTMSPLAPPSLIPTACKEKTVASRFCWVAQVQESVPPSVVPTATTKHSPRRESAICESNEFEP